MVKRKVTESVKKSIAVKQNFKCANFPGSNIIPDYECVYHKYRSGVFDESGYEIDHIIEFAETQDDFDPGAYLQFYQPFVSEIQYDKVSNLHALCIPCHHVKTTHFNRVKRLIENQIIEKVANIIIYIGKLLIIIKFLYVVNLGSLATTIIGIHVLYVVNLGSLATTIILINVLMIVGWIISNDDN